MFNTAVVVTYQTSSHFEIEGKCKNAQRWQRSARTSHHTLCCPQHTAERQSIQLTTITNQLQMAYPCISL